MSEHAHHRRIRRALGAVLLFGCGAGAAPAGVVLPSTGAAAASVSARAPACSIHGGGELFEGANEPKPLPLFATAREAKPGLVIEDSRDVAATWSELPPIGAPARAAIELGGQKLLRVHAYASLAGRGFQLRTRGYAVREHLWIDWGYPVELLGTDHGELVVRRLTGFTRPPFVEARVACDVVAWERTAFLEPYAAEDDGDLLQPSVGSLAIYTAPSGSPFIEIVPSDRGFAFWERERRDRWVHVRSHFGGFGIDGWVHEGDVKEAGPGSISLGNIRTIGRDGPAPRMVRVRRDSQVLVGASHEPFADAVFEEGALLDSWSVEEGLLRVTFENRVISAPGGMWIAERDIEPP